MTGIFTYKNFALSDTPRLDTKVAVVTVCFSLASLFWFGFVLECHIFLLLKFGFSSLPKFKVRAPLIYFAQGGQAGIGKGKSGNLFNPVEFCFQENLTVRCGWICVFVCLKDLTMCTRNKYSVTSPWHSEGLHSRSKSGQVWSRATGVAWMAWYPVGGEWGEDGVYRVRFGRHVGCEKGSRSYSRKRRETWYSDM